MRGDRRHSVRLFICFSVGGASNKGVVVVTVVTGANSVAAPVVRLGSTFLALVATTALLSGNPSNFWFTTSRFSPRPRSTRSVTEEKSYLGTTVNIDSRPSCTILYSCLEGKTPFRIRAPLFGRRRRQIYPFSIAKVLLKKLLRFQDPGRPKFYFGEKGTPEEVRLTSCYIFQGF